MSTRPATTLVLTLLAALQLALQPLALGGVCLMGWVPDAACCDAAPAGDEAGGGCCGEEDADDADDAASGGCDCELRSQDEPRLPATPHEPCPDPGAPLFGPALEIAVPTRRRAPERGWSEVTRPPGHGPPRHLLFGVFLI